LRYPRIGGAPAQQTLTIVDTSVVCSEIEVEARTLDEMPPRVIIGK
jgi:putative (di)nucleoside polyphosphate hydrolase